MVFVFIILLMLSTYARSVCEQLDNEIAKLGSLTPKTKLEKRTARLATLVFTNISDDIKQSPDLEIIVFTEESIAGVPSVKLAAELSLHFSDDYLRPPLRINPKSFLQAKPGDNFQAIILSSKKYFAARNLRSSMKKRYSSIWHLDGDVAEAVRKKPCC